MRHVRTRLTGVRRDEFLGVIVGRLGRLELARWAGCSAVQVGRHVKC